MTKRLVASCIAFLALGAARADDVCSADAEKLCAGVLRGDGRILTCLHANEAQLSPACKQRVSFVGKKVREIGTACGDDVAEFCPDVKMGGGRILKCLSGNSAKLSPGCQKTVQLAEEKSTEFRKVCGPDAEKLCKGVARGQGRVLACLGTKEAELTAECKTFLQPVLAMGAAGPAAPAAAAAAAAAGAAPAAAASAAEAAKAVPAAAAPAAEAAKTAPSAPAAAPAATPDTSPTKEPASK